VKQSLHKLGQALRASGVRGSQISRQSKYEGGKVASPTHKSSLPTLPPGNTSTTADGMTRINYLAQM